jgi:GSCFA family
MQFQLPIQITAPEKQISYHDKILLIGSCFTEHIGNALDELKFRVLQNPHGILFDPISVCKSLDSYIENKKYVENDLFQLNEVWNSWQHHSRFSNINKEECLRVINHSQQQAHDFLKQTDWLVITLGSSFSYRLKADSSQIPPPIGGGRGGGMAGVANCHRAPAQWFDKHLLTIDETAGELKDCIDRLLEFNKHLKIIFTISPVRHIRDGVVENNRSKARLIEAVHQTIAEYKQLYYFPAYELVIDVLRDYRFYDIDLAHPNYMATEFVMEKFKTGFIDESSQKLMEEIRKIVIAKKHKAFQPATNAHKQFLKAHFEKTKELLEKYPFLSLREELDYFNS